MNIWKEIRAYLRLTTSIADQIDKEAAEASIRRNIYFRGPNVWILVFSIIIASVGLNINSTAVIIGAMLISPLLGPITGIGLGLGINDTKLLGEGAKNLLVMVFISLLASSLYFLLSPLNLANPTELEARTTPSIYDILIALFGGFAGILEQARKEKGTVLSGVAIATALMPPLCTAGYGIAKGSLHFFVGAMGLFIINAIFITLATYIAAKYFHFQGIKFENEVSARRTNRLITAIVILVTIPSIWSAAVIIRNNSFTAAVENFVAENRVFGKNYIYNYQITQGRNRNVTFYTTGDGLNGQDHLSIMDAAAKFGIPGEKINLVDSNISSDTDNTDEMTQGIFGILESQLSQKDSLINSLKTKIDAMGGRDIPYSQIAKEVSVQWPEIKEIFLSRGASVTTDSLSASFGTLAIIKAVPPLSTEKVRRLEKWLQVRLDDTSVAVHQE